MKKALLSLFFYTLCSLQLSAQKRTYIEKDAAGNKLEGVYIDFDKNNSAYENITAFAHEDEVKNYLREYEPGYTATSMPLPFGKWCRLYRYNGVYYAYAPANWNNNHQIQVSRTTFITYTDSKFCAITEYKKKNKGVFEFTINDPRLVQEDSTCGTVFISVDSFYKKTCIIIDRTRKIVAWYGLGIEERDQPILMVPAKNVRNFPVIVMSDAADKTKEFVFDAVTDFMKKKEFYNENYNH